jgi:hypothetical protein
VQASVPGEVRWRVDLYSKSFEFCRQGNFSFARFVALVPDRLRIVFGEGALARIPIAVDPAARELFARALAAGPSPRAPKDPKELRRAIRAAQLDPELDPLSLVAWLAPGGAGEELLSACGSIYRQGLEEIGRGEGGEEAAYLAHLLLVESLSLSAGSIPARLLGGAMLGLSLQALLETDQIRGDAISARLGYLFQLTTSGPALGVEPDALAKRRLNAYRTAPAAVQLARRVIQDPIEVLPLRRVVASLAKRIEVDPELERELTLDLLLEMVRDAAMLALLMLQSHRRRAELEPIAGVCRSEHALLQHVQNDRRRALLLESVSTWADIATSEAPKAVKALDALRSLLRAAPDVLGGDRKALGVHGSLEERADLAATGAVALVLDEKTDALRREVGARIQEVPASEWARGRCYRLSSDGSPLYRLPERKNEAHLYVDISELVARAGARRAKSLGESMFAGFFRPMLALADRLRGGRSREALSPSRLVADSVAFRGDIVAIMDLATGIERIVQDLANELGRPTSDALGGGSTRPVEIRDEIRSMEARLASVEGALRRLEDESSRGVLADGKVVLERQLAVLRAVERDDVAPVLAPAYIGFGDVAEEVALAGLELTSDRIVFTPHLEEGKRGTARSAIVAAERTARLERARAIDGTAEHATRASIRSGEVYSEGLLLSDAALDAWRRAKHATLAFEDAEVGEVERSAVIDREIERLLVARRIEDRSVAAVFREVGELDGTGMIWERIPIDSAVARAIEPP